MEINQNSKNNSGKKSGKVNVKRLYKKDLKKYSLYWLLLIPFVVLSIVGLSFTLLSSFWRVFITVCAAFVIVVVVETIKMLMIKKKETKPRKFDPFAD